MTTSSSATGHGLSDGGEIVLTEGQCRTTGVPLEWAGKALKTLNKKAVRLTVKISANDRYLKFRPKWAKQRVADEWYDLLDAAAGGASRTWYLYFGTIEPKMIIEAIETQTGRAFNLSDESSWPERLPPEVWKA